MSYFVVIIITILILMMAISQYSAFKSECKNVRVRNNFLILSFCVAISPFINALMIASYGTSLCVVMYAIDKFIKVTIMGFIVYMTQDIIGIDTKYTSIFISIMSYSTVVLFVIDSIFKGGKLTEGLYGVHFEPGYSWIKIIYIIYYMIYDIVLLIFLIYKASIIFKTCHRHELNLLFYTYSFSAVGFTLELFNVIFDIEYIPYTVLFNLVSLIFLRKLLIYHESISIERSAFENELNPASLDITFILDDELNIIYQNKRAEVFGQIVDDTYIGRKITEVFSFNDDAYGQINSEANDIPFGITAEYNPNNHRVNMVIQHKVDSYGEILASVVYVYNMEDEVKRDRVDQKVEIEDNLITENVISITKGARTLVIDDDVVFSNIMTRLLKQYEVTVERAFSGTEGIEQVKNNVYDIIFVALEMNRISGDEIVRKIRSMVGEYYKQVPIVYLLQSDINDVFDKFVDSGFNDYLLKPINNKNLSLVLTRWLWQRFDDVSAGRASVSTTIDAHFYELTNLLNIADYMLDKEDYKHFSYVIKGIFKCTMMVGMVDVAVTAKKLQTAIIIENTAEITRLYNMMSKDIRNLITI